MYINIHKHYRYVLTMFCCLIMCSSVYGKSSLPVDSLVVQSLRLYDAGDYLEAYDLSTRALTKLNKKNKKHRSLYLSTLIINAESAFYAYTDRDSYIIEQLKEAIEYNITYNINVYALIESGMSLVFLYNRNSEFEKAIEYYEAITKTIVTIEDNIYAEEYLPVTNEAIHAYVQVGQQDKACEILSELLLYVKNNRDEDYYFSALSYYYENYIIKYHPVDKVALKIYQEFSKDLFAIGEIESYLEIAINQASMLYMLGEFQEAYSLLDSLIQSSMNLSPYQSMSILQTKATAASRLGKTEEAISLLEESREYVDENDAEELFDIDFQKAIILIDTDLSSNLDMAAEILDHLLERQEVNDELRATYLYNRALACKDSEKAIEYLQSALVLYERSTGHSIYYAKTINSIGQQYNNLRDYRTAIGYFEIAKALFLRLSGPHNYSYISTLSNLGEAAFYNKEYGRCIATLEKSRELQKELPQGPVRCDAWRLLIGAYNHVGNYEKEDEVHEDYRRQYSSMQYASDKILFNLHELDDAIMGFGSTDAPETYIVRLDSLLSIYPLDELTDIRFDYERLKNRCIENTEDVEIDDNATIQYLADIDYLQSFDGGILMDYSRRFFKDDPKSSNEICKVVFPLFKNDCNYLSFAMKCADACNDAEWIEALSNASLEFINSRYESIIGLSPEEVAFYWQDMQSLKTLLFQVRSKSSINTELYELLLTYKNFLQISEINTMRYLKNCGDSYLKSQYDELLLVRKQLQQAKQQNEGAEQIESLSLKEVEINRSIAFHIKDYSVFDIYGRCSVTDISSSLKDHEIAIEIFDNEIDNDREYGAFILRKGWLSPVLVDICKESELQRYLITRPEKLYEEGSMFRSELSNLIWKPLSQYINNKDQIYISLAGSLNLIAIEALDIINNSGSQMRCDIHRVTSTKNIHSHGENEKFNNAIVYGGIRYDISNLDAHSGTDNIINEIGYSVDRGSEEIIPYLKGTKEEAETIGTILMKNGIDGRVILGAEATEESIKLLSQNSPNIIHIATHGFYKPREAIKKTAFYDNNGEDEILAMQRSGLLFAGSNEAWSGKIPTEREDGVLTAWEISNLDLTNSNMVVLSACETGQGEVTEDGIEGLQRGFKRAGVESIVMSLWKVDDKATAMLMKSFYTALASGYGKHEALQKAKDTLKGKKRYSNPYYWAPFIMLD